MSEHYDKLEYLKVLIDKHKEQATLYYARVNVYLAVLVMLVGITGVTIFTGIDKIGPRPFWIIIAFENMLCVAVSYIFCRIIATAANWIDSWQAKIIYFESHNAPEHQSWWLFLDRHLENTKPEFKEREELKAWNRTRWEKHLRRFSEQPPSASSGIARWIKRFIIVMIISFSIFTAISIFCAIIGYDLQRKVTATHEGNIQKVRDEVVVPIIEPPVPGSNSEARLVRPMLVPTGESRSSPGIMSPDSEGWRGFPFGVA